MHTFYQLYESIDYNNAVVYSFGFNGYFNLLSHTSTNINNFKLSKTTFSKKSKPVFKKMYYPKFINETKDDIIMNDCNILAQFLHVNNIKLSDLNATMLPNIFILDEQALVFLNH